MRMLVLGAGLQGSACAYDLLQNPNVTEVRLADLNVSHLPDFLHEYSGKRLIPTPLDVRDHDAVLAVMRESKATMSAIPYYFNLDLARLAVQAGTNFCDLGGNTEIVFQQKELDAEARKAKVTIVPDCGLAPGMVNILAQYGIQQLDDVKSVKIFVGGLPQHPEGPLGYQIVYSLEGVLDYYTTLSWIVRDGKRAQVKALSEREPVMFPKPVGELEAFHTAGGLSTMAWRYEGKIPSMEYKTLRYPGHAHIMEAIRELGLLDLAPVDVKGTKVVPRDAHGGDDRSAPHEAEGARSRRAARGGRGNEGRRGEEDRLGAARLLRRVARHQRDDAHHGLFAVDHRADAGEAASSSRASTRRTSAFRPRSTSPSWRSAA